MMTSILDLAYPGIAALGHIPSQAEAVETAKKYIATHYPEATLALLFGSYARNEQRQYSDLDIMVIVPKFALGKSCEMLRSIHGGLRIETFIYTETTFIDALRRQKKIGKPVYNNALTEGILLRGDTALRARLKEISDKMCEDRSAPLDSETLSNFRIALSSQLLKLSILTAHFERIQYASLIYNSLCFAVIKHETGWASPLERLPRSLSEHLPELGGEMQAGFLAICRGEEPGAFIEAATALLDRLGGPSWSGTKENLALATSRWTRLVARLKLIGLLK